MFDKKHNIVLISFLIAAVFCIPFYAPTVFAGLDLRFHLSRIDGIITAVKDLQFPLAVYPEKNFGFGYASPLFYCDLFLLPAALLYAIHIPLVIVYKVYVFCIAWIGAASALYAMNEFTDRPWLCFFGAVVYTFSSYHINDFFIRAALGEAMAFSILPLFAVISKHFFEEEKNNTLELALFFSCLALCHLITFALTAAVFAVLMLIYWKTVFRPKRLLSFFTAVGIGFLLCAFFLVPLLQQLRSQKFLFAQNRELFGEEIMYRYNNTLLSALSDYVLVGYYDLEQNHYFTGLMMVVTPVLFFLTKKTKPLRKLMMSFTIISLVLLVCTTNLLPLHKISFLQSIQFTYRFNILIAGLLPFVLVNTLDSLKTKPLRIAVIVMSLYMAVNTGVIYHQLFTEEDQISNTALYQELFTGDFYENYNNHYNVAELSSGEYLPATHHMDYEALQNGVDLYDTTAYSVSYSRTGTESLLSMNASTDGFAAIPVTWYLGYLAESIDQDNPVVLPISSDEYTGRIVIPIQAGEHTYRVHYKGTTVQRLSALCSIGSLVILLGWMIVRLAKNAQ